MFFVQFPAELLQETDARNNQMAGTFQKTIEEEIADAKKEIMAETEKTWSRLHLELEKCSEDVTQLEETEMENNRRLESVSEKVSELEESIKENSSSARKKLSMRSS